MNRRNDIEVIINNKRYTLSGYENEEYMQKLAAFINNKCNELRRQEIYKTLDSDMKNVFTQINLADEYFKVKRQLEESEADGDSKSNEIYGLKHEIISLQSKIEKADKEIEELKKANIEEQKKNVKLETELSSEKRNKPVK